MRNVLSRAGIALLGALTAAVAMTVAVLPARAATAGPSASPSESPSASPSPVPSPTPTYILGACHASLSPYAWVGGYTFNTTVTWQGKAPIRWQVAVTVPAGHQLINSWPFDAVQHGNKIFFDGSPPDTVLQPQQSVTLGYNAYFTGDFVWPTAISMNGVPCTLS